VDARHGIVLGVTRDRAYESFDRRARRDDDLAGEEVLLRSHDELVDEHPLGCTIPDPWHELRPRAVVERRETEVLPDPALVRRVGLLARGGRSEEDRSEAELSRDVVVDLHGDRGVILTEEAAVSAQHAQLHREAEALVVAAATTHFDEIWLGEHPVACELVVAEIGRDRRLHVGTRIMDEIVTAGTGFRGLTESVDTTSPAGRG
jgi:hypothetical protein